MCDIVNVNDIVKTQKHKTQINSQHLPLFFVKTDKLTGTIVA